MSQTHKSDTALGQRVRDTLSGIEGTVVAITFWQHGCTRVIIQPEGEKNDGGPKDSFAVDEPQVEKVAPAPAERAAPRHGGRNDKVAAAR